MTPSEINAAIAGWMGWSKEKLDARADWELADQQMQWGEISIEDFYRRHLRVDPTPEAPPNFHGDLNACWNAEEHLETAIGSVHDYLSNLKLVVLRDCQGPFAEASMVHATATERSEALLRTLNLWKE